MIFSTLNQLNCLLIFIFYGIVLGLIFSFFDILFLRKNEKLIKKTIICCNLSAIFIIFFSFLENIFNLGKFSLSLFIGFSLGFFWIKKLVFNLVVFLQNKWYNVFKSIQKEPKKVARRKKN